MENIEPHGAVILMWDNLRHLLHFILATGEFFFFTLYNYNHLAIYDA